MNHNSNRYDDSPDSWPIRSSCGGGCGGGASRMGVSQMPQRWDESWQPDYVPKAPANPRGAMPRFYPDEQPDAVAPVFSRSGVERPVPPRYDDSPDSPNFYAPRIPQTMQPPGMQRPWDDGPDSPNFYGQPVPPVMQPPGMPMQQRLWDDGPDTDNFYRPSSRNQLEMGRSVFQPWEEQPDAPNFSSQRMVETRQVPRFKPWDDGPDSDNFYRQGRLGLQEMPAVTTRPWDDGPDTDNFYRGSFSNRTVSITRMMDDHSLPDYVQPRLAGQQSSNFQMNDQTMREKSSPSLYRPQSITGNVTTGAPLALTPTADFVQPTALIPVREWAASPRYWFAYQNSRAVGKTSIHFTGTANDIGVSGLFEACKNNFLLNRNVVVVPDACTRAYFRSTGQPLVANSIGSTFGTEVSLGNLLTGPPVNPFSIGTMITAAERFLDLGIPEENLTTAVLQAQNLGFNCFKLLSGRNIPPKVHDLAYYMCDPLTVRYQLRNLRWKGMKISRSYDFMTRFYPGDLYGWIPLQEPGGWVAGGLGVPAPPLLDAGTNVYYLFHGEWPRPWAVNSSSGPLLSWYLPWLSRRNRAMEALFLSLGGKIENTSYPDTFETKGAWNSGLFMSGGAVINQQTHKAVGIAMESIPKPSEFDIIRTPDLVGPSWNTGTVKNAYFFSLFPNSTNSYAHHLVNLERQSSPSPPPFPIIPGGQPTKWVGGGGNFLQTKKLMCPSGYLAAGVIGSGTDRFSGNMGIICLPFASEGNYQFHKAVVNAGGCSATWIPPVHQANFQEYISRVPAWFVPANPESGIKRNAGFVQGQSFAMCPPGFYLTGMKVEHGFATGAYGPGKQVVTAILSLDCRYWDEADLDYTRSTESPTGYYIGRPASGPASEVSDQNISCGGGRMFVNGIEIDASTYTNGFRLTCAGVPNFSATPYP